MLHLRPVQKINGESDGQVVDQTQQNLVISLSSLFVVNKGGPWWSLNVSVG